MSFCVRKRLRAIARLNGDHVTSPPPAELVLRLAARPKPMAGRHYTIDGSQETDVRRQVDRSNESRIAQLLDSLMRAHEGVSTDHRLAALHGHAKVEFGRNR